MTEQKPTIQLDAERLTFVGLLRLIETDADLPTRRKRDLMSNLRSFARLLEIDMEHSLAGIAPYRERLDGFDPVAAGVTSKRWANVRSDVTAALDRYGIRKGERPTPSDLIAAWRQLREEAKLIDIRFVRGLSRFIHYCSSRAIAPNEVDDSVMESFGAFLAGETLHRKPRHAHRRTCVLWNRAVNVIDAWPRQVVEIPSYRNCFSLPLMAFPASFRHDLDRWLSILGGKHLLAVEAPLRPCRPATLHAKREQVRRLASALVLGGHRKETITSLACLVEPDNFRVGLEFLLNRSGGKSTPSLYELGYCMLGLAKHWVKVGDNHLGEMRALVARLNCRQRGLTDRNRSILRQFDDDMNVLRLVSLPEALAAAAAKRRNPVRAALLVQTALAIEVLLNTPIRLRNLCGLRFDRHFDQSRPGRKGVVHLVIPAEAVKNNEPLEFELPASVTRLLTLYRKRHLPGLVDGAPIFVFPGQNGGPKHVVTLSGQIVKAIRRNAGLTMTVHAFRHVAAKLYLDRNPGAYALVSRLLGHKSIQTTLTFYAGFESKAAGRAYDREILRLRGNKSGSSRHG